MNNDNPFARAVSRIGTDGQLLVFLVTIPIFALIGWTVAVYFPVLVVGILLAYLMDGIVAQMVSWRVNRTFAISSVMIFTILMLLLILLFALPQLATQIANLLQNLGGAVPAFKSWADETLASLPEWMQAVDSQAIIDSALAASGDLAKSMLETTVASAGNIFNIIIYTVLTPIMVFFLLRDKKIIFAWLSRYIPHSKIFSSLYVNLHEQFGAYVRGKIIEGVIVFFASMIGFSLLGLNYAFLLSVAIGLSVIIPFVGAVAVTFPVLIVAGLQFGLSAEFWYVAAFYMVVQILDGHVLVPLLFSEIVHLHPIGLLTALVVFGSIWGMWGIFFAIPLASLIKCFLNAVETRLAEKLTA